MGKFAHTTTTCASLEEHTSASTACRDDLFPGRHPDHVPRFPLPQKFRCRPPPLQSAQLCGSARPHNDRETSTFNPLPL